MAEAAAAALPLPPPQPVPASDSVSADVDAAAALIEGLLPKGPKRITVPNPLERIEANQGFMDILDVFDLVRLTDSQRFKEAGFMPHMEHPIVFHRMAHNVIQQPEWRIRKAAINEIVEFSVSQRDLDQWTSDATHLDSPCRQFPFRQMLARLIPHESPHLQSERIVPMAATLKLLTNTEDLPASFGRLKAGCSLALDHLERQANLLGEAKAHQFTTLHHYMMLTRSNPNRLVYQVTLQPCTKATETEIMPLPEDLEAEILSRQAFLSVNAIHRGTMRHEYTDPKTNEVRTYRIVPENHGMSDELKRHAEKYVSKARVFASALPGRFFLRVPEKAFIRSAERMFEVKQQVIRELDMKAIHVYLGLKQPGDDGYAPDKASTVPQDPEGYDKKHTIKVRLSMVYWYPAFTPDKDVFLAHPQTVGLFPPGVVYRDTLLDHFEYIGPPQGQEGPANQLYAKGKVKPLYMAEYLEKESKRRTAVREGKPDEKSRQDLPYLDLLCEQL